MFDGYNFIGAKAYKDSKLCLSTLSAMLHDRYNKQTAIAFSTVCPGHIASSEVFEGASPQEASSVPTTEAARRLFQVAHDGRCSKSGVYWSWLEGQAYARVGDRPSQPAPLLTLVGAR